MAESLKIGKLIRESTGFVFDHLELVRHYMTVIFPAILILALINVTAENYDLGWVVLVTYLPSTYLYACFALSWHRASLQGADPSHKVNPFRIDPASRNFLIVFFVLAIVPVLALAFGSGLIASVSASGNMLLIVSTIVITLIGGFYFFLWMVRYSFKLPAHSVGVGLTMQEAKRASRGLIWRLVVAVSCISLIFILCVSLYGFITALGLGMILMGEQISAVMSIFTGFFLSIPIHIAVVILAAINVTMLSKTYQWGMQNNA